MGDRQAFVNAALRKIYYDPSHPAGYGTREKLQSAVGHRFTSTEISTWLQRQDPHTLHRPRKLKFTRSRYFVPNMNNLFQADLCDMRSFQKYNKNVAYILTVVDVFCKKAWAVPLKRKNAATIVEALRSIFRDRKPLYLQTDKGKEFVAKQVQDYLKHENVKFYTSQNPDTKCSVVERFNRTLKTKMWKYFTYANSYRYVDILQDLIHAYKNTKHSAIGMTPNQVNKRNQKQVYAFLYGGKGRYGTIKKADTTSADYKSGDHVRITRDKYAFEKGYETNWSTEVFVISKIIKTTPLRYEIKDLRGEDIEGSFYSEELQRVRTDADTVFKIDKIIATRGSGASRQVFVKWRGYSDKFNSWVLASSTHKP